MSPRLCASRGFLLLASVLLISVSAFAQANWDSVAKSNSLGSAPKIYTAGDEGKIDFRAETVLVQVPVVVTDKSGSHIHGLTKEDFRLLENGKEQKISAFEEIVSTTTKFVVPSEQPGEFRNLTLSEQQPRPVTVIVLDTVNTPFLDQAKGRFGLVKFLADNLDTHQVLALMIITSSGVNVVQGLTGDPEQLLQVLKRVSGELPATSGIDTNTQAAASTGDVPTISLISPSTTIAGALRQMDAFVKYGDILTTQYQQQRAIEITLNAFTGIAWSLSGVPGRKSVIWATSGFPFNITTPDQVPGGYLSPLYERAMKALTDAQISIYPVDVSGITTRGEGEASALPGVFPSSANTQTQGANLRNRAWLRQTSVESLLEFADMTGGKAFYNSNDLAAGFKRAADDSSSYYQISYYLDTKNNRAGWRQLKVQLNRKDVEVRARKGFFVTNATVHPDVTRNSDLSNALNSPIEGTGVPVTMKWLGVSGEGDKKKASFEIQILANGVTVEGGDPSKVNFDLAVAAYGNKSKDGKPVLSLGKTVATVVSPQQLAALKTKGIGMTNTLDLSPGQYAVRVVIRDNVTGKVGSVTAPLTVN